MENEILFLKQLIENFLQTRMQAKIEKEKDENKHQKIRQTYQPETWLADAARRVTQIQLVSHAVKFQNPNAKGTNIYLSSNQHSQRSDFISTQTLIERRDDVVGNAAALDVFKFLQLSHDGKTLLAMILSDAPNFRAALPGNETQKDEWLNAFAGLAKIIENPASHRFAKQIYFPVTLEQYHVIAPLFPSSLVQAVYEQIQTRFAEVTVAARAARKNNKPYPQGYSEYINLAVQTIGGSKPQNVSQLNSTRGGKCYLLPSLPPTWKSVLVKPPLNKSSIFPVMRPRVRVQLKELRSFLTKFQHRNDKDIRLTRAKLVAEIYDQLLFFASQIQNLPSGWSADSTCNLDEFQTFWLDPGRVKIDAQWAEQRKLSDWRKEVSNQFALWFNTLLESKKLHFGDAEHHEWQGILQRELSLLRETL